MKKPMQVVRRAALTLAGVLVPTVLWAGNVTIPHAFAPNTPAKAQDVNDNFAAIVAALNKTTTFQHVSNATNTVANATCFDNPATTGDPNVQITVTRVWGPAGVHSQEHIASGLAVYQGGNGQWCISREDLQNMPIDAVFNVIAVKP